MNTRLFILMMLVAPFVGCTEAETLPAANRDSGTSENLTLKTSDTNQADAKAPQQKAVVTLTDAAVAMVRQFQKQDSKPYLRVAVKSGGPTGFIYDLRLDDHLNSDEDYLDESHGLKIVVDKKSAQYIDGTSIDWQITDTGQEGFHFANPNAMEQ